MKDAGVDDATRRAGFAATVVSGLLIAQQVAGKATRDALFLSTFHVSSLPAVMMVSSLLSIVAVLVLSRALRRRPPWEVVPLTAGLASVLLLLEWAISLAAPRVAAVLVYLHMALFGGTLISGFWSLVNERFDPYTAKRVVGRIGFGASVGGLTGGLLAWGASRLIPVPSMLVVMSLLSLASFVGLRKVGRGHMAPSSPETEVGGGRSAFDILRGVPYLRDLALVVALGALTDSLLDFVLKLQAAAAFTRGAQLMSFFAVFNAALGLLGLVVQTVVARSSLRVLGLAGTVAVRPGTVLLLAVLGLLDPRMWSAVVARAGQEINSSSLFRSGYELLYTPLPEAEKRPAKAVIDVGFDKLGSLLGGGVALLVVALAPSLITRVLFAIAIVLCLITLAFTGRLHRGYVRTLEQSLRAGRVRLEVSDVPDEATRLTLAHTNLALNRETLLREIEALRAGGATTPTRDGSPGLVPGEPARDEALAHDTLLQAIADLRSGLKERVRRALREAPEPSAALVPHLIPLLARDDLFSDVLRALRRVAPSATGQLLDALLDPHQLPAVRRRLPRVLKTCPTRRAVDGLLLGLEDGSFEVRAQCTVALAAITSKHPSLAIPREVCFAVVLRELRHAESARTGEGGDPGPDIRLEHVFGLLSLALEREPLQIASWALRGSDPVLRGTALEYLENVLPEGLRHALWPRLGEHMRAPRSVRPPQAIREDLLRSSDALSLGREALKDVAPLKLPLSKKP